jgi:hypothetical protein
MYIRFSLCAALGEPTAGESRALELKIFLGGTSIVVVGMMARIALFGLVFCPLEPALYFLISQLLH